MFMKHMLKLLFQLYGGLSLVQKVQKSNGRYQKLYAQK
ncbi:hypothetical protein BSM4216_3144 [Bacillus smithii]|nr:hypothetical protein BSM4216_3144 [Bacillus smithii]